jgi:CHASE2 domain-containing sensor protein
LRFANLVFLLGAQILSNPFQNQVLITAQNLGIILPFVVLFALLAGILDGKLRFKKLHTPLLIRKMIAGGIFFICSIVID